MPTAHATVPKRFGQTDAQGIKQEAANVRAPIMVATEDVPSTSPAPETPKKRPNRKPRGYRPNREGVRLDTVPRPYNGRELGLEDPRVLERQKKAYDLRAQSYANYQIAQLLQVDPQTVARDVQAEGARRLAERIESRDILIDLQREAYDSHIVRASMHVEKLRRDAELPGKSVREVLGRLMIAASVEKTVVALLVQREKLLGLTAPTKVEIEDKTPIVHKLAQATFAALDPEQRLEIMRRAQHAIKQKPEPETSPTYESEPTDSYDA